MTTAPTTAPATEATSGSSARPSTAPLQSGDDQAKVRNTLSLITQAGLKPAGAKVTTDLGKDASTVPATIAFANDPSDEAQKRTYRTTVKLGQDTYTWTITGRTACVAD